MSFSFDTLLFSFLSSLFVHYLNRSRRIRTTAWKNQSLLPYHLAIPLFLFSSHQFLPARTRTASSDHSDVLPIELTRILLITGTDTNGIRTRDTTVKGWCLNHLTMVPYTFQYGSNRRYRNRSANRDEGSRTLVSGL